MTKRYSLFSTPAIVLFASLSLPLTGQAQFTPGNLAVLRVGDGTTSLNSAAAPVFIDEYTPAGNLVGTTPLPASGTDNKLTNSGTSTSEGMLTLSANGQYLLTTGYNAEVGTAGVTSSTSASTPRTVARISRTKTIDISTALTNAFSGGNIRSAASLDGSSFLLAGSNGGVRYATLGATTSSLTSTTVASTRVVHIYRNQVFFSSGAGTAPGIYVVGAATNTAGGQPASSFINTSVVTTNNGTVGSPYGFVLLDRDPNVLGIDAAYVADDGIGGSAGGIQKWSFDGTTWTKQGTIGSAFRGLTGTLRADGSVLLYATNPTSAGGNLLVTVNDVNAYNAAPSETTPTTLVRAGANQALRGVDFTPGTPVALPVELTSFTATRAAAGTRLQWATASELNSDYFLIERSNDGRAFAPIGRVPAHGTTILASSYASLDPTAPPSLHYYRLRQVDQDGSSSYSAAVAVAPAAAAWSLAPNPAAASLDVHTTEPAAYFIRNTLGQVLLSGLTTAGSTTIGVAQLPAGSYFFELHSSAGRLVRRFAKQ